MNYHERMVDSPKAVSCVENVTLIGYLTPLTSSNQPVWLSVLGSSDIFWALFSTEKLLRETLSKANVSFDKIMRVEDSEQFLGSVPEKLSSGVPVRIVLNMRFFDDGRVRYKQVQR